MSWLLLVAAGLLEVVWALGLRYSEGFTRPTASAVTALAIIGSMLLLGRATAEIPLGTAYAVWVGIGVLGATLGGAVLFAEPLPPIRIACMALLLLAIVGLKLTSGRT